MPRLRNEDWDISEFIAYAEQRRKTLGLSHEAAAERITYDLNPGLTPADPQWRSYRSRELRRALVEGRAGREHMTPKVTAAYVTGFQMADAEVYRTLPEEHRVAVEAILGRTFRLGAVAS